MAVIKRPGNKYFLLNYVGVIVCLLVKENVTKKIIISFRFTGRFVVASFFYSADHRIEQTINTKQRLLLSYYHNYY